MNNVKTLKRTTKVLFGKALKDSVKTFQTLSIFEGDRKFAEALVKSGDVEKALHKAQLKFNDIVDAWDIKEEISNNTAITSLVFRSDRNIATYEDLINVVQPRLVDLDAEIYFQDTDFRDDIISVGYDVLEINKIDLIERGFDEDAIEYITNADGSLTIEIFVA